MEKKVWIWNLCLGLREIRFFYLWWTHQTVVYSSRVCHHISHFVEFLATSGASLKPMHRWAHIPFFPAASCCLLLSAATHCCSTRCFSYCDCWHHLVPQLSCCWVLLPQQLSALCHPCPAHGPSPLLLSYGSRHSHLQPGHAVVTATCCANTAALSVTWTAW